jgi:predicted deacylase
MSGPRIPIEKFQPDAFEPGSTTRGLLTAATGPSGEVELPVIVTRGTRPGPSALLVAGVHGDEFEGVAALGRLAGRIDPATTIGTVITLPVANPFAYHAQLRTSPASLDGANLAREFPGDPDGTPTQRLAAALMSLATRLLGPEDLVVDLHSAGTRYRYLTLVGYRDFGTPAAAASEQAARHFGDLGQLLWAIWPQPTMFNSETTLAGIPTVAAEAPGQGGCRHQDVERYAVGVANLLRYLRILPGPEPRADHRAAGVPTELGAETDGLFVAHADVGEPVAEGQLIAQLTDPFGEVLTQLHAPHPGVVWAIRTFGTVQQGEYVAWIGPAQ